MLTISKPKKPITLAEQVETEDFIDQRIGNLKHYVRRVRRVFKGVNDHSGRPVKDDDIFTEVRMEMMMCLGSPLAAEGAEELVYKAMDIRCSREEKMALERNGKVEPAIELMINLVRRTIDAKVPHCYRIGVIAVWVEVVMGKAVAPLWKEYRHMLEEAMILDAASEEAKAA